MSKELQKINNDTGNEMTLSERGLPEGYETIREEVAAAVHDAWAKEKIADGWKAAGYRDAKIKLDDRLIPYKELPEEEKKYDRTTAEAAIRALLSCGYKITKEN